MASLIPRYARMVKPSVSQEQLLSPEPGKENMMPSLLSPQGLSSVLFGDLKRDGGIDGSMMYGDISAVRDVDNQIDGGDSISCASDAASGSEKKPYVPKAYAWGRNKDGELSVGQAKEVLEPKPVKGLKGRRIEFIAPGGQHTAAILDNGQLIICGSALHGKLGIEGLFVTAVLKFQPVSLVAKTRVRQVACGDYHTLCLLEDSSVYTWGGTLHKKLGHTDGDGGADDQSPAPVRSLLGKNVIAVDCGDFHSVALTAEGEVYSWGGGGTFFNRGQCGHGHNHDVISPQLIEGLVGKRVIQISCGGYHTMALTANEQVYSWGAGLYGECGVGDFINTLSPTLVKELQGKHVVDITCGGHHSLVLTASRSVYSFGYGSNGQLGIGTTTNQCQPQLVEDMERKEVTKIAAGWNHSMLLTAAGDVYVCGHGEFGQLGLGDTNSVVNFTLIPFFADKMVTGIIAGGNHSFAVLDSYNPFKTPTQIEMVVKKKQSTSRPSTPPRSALTPAAKLHLTPPRAMTSMFQDFIALSPAQLDNAKSKTLDNGLRIIYTDVGMSHRFCRYRIDPSYQRMAQDKVNAFVQHMYKSDTGMAFHRIQEDVEVVGHKLDFHLVENGLSYTCYMVSDLGQSKELSLLSIWVDKFLELVAPFCSQLPRFTELRPKQYLRLT
eukprot:GILK01006874.1.p1 GENE.GILK01006874.1~~GILK01006874.1.p1  ORF type:complete len:663 (+),score=97.84 GILK01006874.1:45-2033(+)